MREGSLCRNGMCVVDAMLKDGSWASTLAQLPSNCRPSKQLSQSHLAKFRENWRPYRLTHCLLERRIYLGLTFCLGDAYTGACVENDVDLEAATRPVCTCWHVLFGAARQKCFPSNPFRVSHCSPRCVVSRVNMMRPRRCSLTGLLEIAHRRVAGKLRDWAFAWSSFLLAQPSGRPFLALA